MQANERGSYVMISSDEVHFLMAAAALGGYVLNDRARTVAIRVLELPEGVWLATSDEVRGLVVECDTRDEAIDLSRELAVELLEAEGRPVDPETQMFTFLFD